MSINYYVLQRATSPLHEEKGESLLAVWAGMSPGRKLGYNRLFSHLTLYCLSTQDIYIFMTAFKILRNIPWKKKVYNIHTPFKINNKANTKHFIKEITVNMKRLSITGG